MNDRASRVVIVGAGHAGGTAAALLRQYGFEGEIALFGEEPTAPYQRPPLSKAWLKGEADADSLKLRPDSFYAEQGIALHLGARVAAIDAGAKTVTLEDGRSAPYDVLILATGSQARKIVCEGAELAGVHELRTLEDAEALKGALGPGERLAVVGGGYVGLEVAASARALGSEAVVIERESRVLARVAGPLLSDFFERYHRERGVEILTGAQVEGFEGDGAVQAVRLADGRRIECDAAVVGVGARACDDLARTAGLTCENGIAVDEQARTSDPSIYAIGDATWRPMPLYGGRMFRLESVPNALEQAKQAASAIAGRPAPPPEVPWFWSDQYDLKLQIAGVPFDADEVIVRGSVDEARFALFHMQGDRLLAVEAVNAPSEFMGGRLLIGRGAAVDRGKLQDLSVPMKAVAA